MAFTEQGRAGTINACAWHLPQTIRVLKANAAGVITGRRWPTRRSTAARATWIVAGPGAAMTCPCPDRGCDDVHAHDVTGTLTLELPPLDLPFPALEADRGE